MKFLKTSPFTYTHLLKGKEWYHQRFDGTPLFICTIADAEMVKDKRKLSEDYPHVRVCFFENDTADWHLDMQDVGQGTQSLIARAKKDPKLSKKMLKAWQADEKKFDDFWEQFQKLELSTLSQKNLISLWDAYYTLALNRFTSSGIIDHFALGSDEIIQKMIEQEITVQSKKALKNSEISNLFAIATAPVHQSFITQAEIELLKIAAGISQETVLEYQQRYFWLHNNYAHSNILPVSHFAKEITNWKTSGKNLRAEIKKLEQTPSESKKKKDQLLKKYTLSRLLRTLLTISEDFTWWQDQRKRATYLHIHMGICFLEEIAKRTGYSAQELKYTTGQEIKNIFEGIPSKKELQARRKNSVFVLLPTGYMVATGKDVQRIRSIMWEKKAKKSIQDFRGLSASLGRVTGPVKIIKSVTEINKVQPGDILVAVMTRPDYVPAMRRAAAIVTNEGGITSHAAIVSRELGIPCIIGTKIATEVLKDGDMVEVNANHGIVKIL